MFAVIYRGYVKPGFEEIYQKHWKKIATFFVEKCGALGSTLHQTEEGIWLAYSKWPDKATRNAAWPRGEERINSKFPEDIHEAIIGLKFCLNDEIEIPEICMEIRDEVSLKKNN